MFPIYNSALIRAVAQSFQKLNDTERQVFKAVVNEMREDWVKSPSVDELSNSKLAEQTTLWQTHLKEPPEKCIFIDDFLILYAAAVVPDELAGILEYGALLDFVKRDPIFPHLKAKADSFSYFVIAHFLIRNNASWQQLAQKGNIANWNEILDVSGMMTVLLPTWSQIKSWLATVTRRHENDCALANVSHWFCQWLLNVCDDHLPNDRQIEDFCADKFLCRYCSALVKGLSERDAKTFDQLASCMFPAASTETSFFVGFALGFADLSAPGARDEYFKLLNKYREPGILKLSDFFKICASFRLHRQELFDLTDKIDGRVQDKDLWTGVLDLLVQANANVDKPWREKTTILLFSRYEPELTGPLDEFLSDIASKDVLFAWDLIELRFSVTAGEEMLERSFTALVKQQQTVFQQKLVKWLRSEDVYLHLAVRKITGMGAFPNFLFYLEKTVFDGLTNSDKLYVAIKTAGYVYTMEALQQLLLSIIKSVDKGNELLEQNFLFLLRDYVVYNYRGTLTLLRKELETPELPTFARKIFEHVINYFEQYFDEMRKLDAPKELSSSQHYKRLYQFYFRAKYGSMPKKVRKAGVMKYFKNTPINANKSAMKRDDEPRHIIKPLAHFSVTGEFPSGEKLNPVYQEYIRRTYQKIERHEIDID